MIGKFGKFEIFSRPINRNENSGRKLKSFLRRSDPTSNSRHYEKIKNFRKFSKIFWLIPIDFERVHKKENRLGGYNNNVLDIYKIPEILSKNCIMEIRVSRMCHVCAGQLALHHDVPNNCDGYTNTKHPREYYCTLINTVSVLYGKIFQSKLIHLNKVHSYLLHSIFRCRGLYFECKGTNFPQ